MKLFLGKGKARDYAPGAGEVLIEEGGNVYAVPETFFCPSCEGSGCRSCGFTGHHKKHATRR